MNTPRRALASVRGRLGPSRPRRLRVGTRPEGDGGQVTAFVVTISAALLLFAGLVLDGGLALSTKTQALDAAQAAARTGAQHLDLTRYRLTGQTRLDPRAAAAAARGWLTRAGLDGDVAATTAEVTVTVHATRRTQLLGLVGVRELYVTATATAAPRTGVTTATARTVTP